MEARAPVEEDEDEDEMLAREERDARATAHRRCADVVDRARRRVVDRRRRRTFGAVRDALAASQDERLPRVVVAVDPTEDREDVARALAAALSSPTTRRPAAACVLEYRGRAGDPTSATDHLTEILRQCRRSERELLAPDHRQPRRRRGPPPPRSCVAAKHALTRWADQTTAFGSIVVIVRDPERAPPTLARETTACLADLRRSAGLPIAVVSLVFRGDTLPSAEDDDDVGPRVREIVVVEADVDGRGDDVADELLDELFLGPTSALPVAFDEGLVERVRDALRSTRASTSATVRALKAASTRHFRRRGTAVACLSDPAFVATVSRWRRLLLADGRRREVALGRPTARDAVERALRRGRLRRRDERLSAALLRTTDRRASLVDAAAAHRACAATEARLARLDDDDAVRCWATAWRDASRACLRGPPTENDDVLPTLLRHLEECVALLSSEIDDDDANELRRERSAEVGERLRGVLAFAVDVQIRRFRRSSDDDDDDFGIPRAVVDAPATLAPARARRSSRVDVGCPVAPSHRRFVGAALARSRRRGAAVALRWLGRRRADAAEWRVGFAESFAGNDADADDAFAFAVYELAHCGLVSRVKGGGRRRDACFERTLVWTNP